MYFVAVQEEIMKKHIDHLLQEKKGSKRLKGTENEADDNIITENENGYDFYWPGDELRENVMAAGESQKAAEEQKYNHLPDDLPDSYSTFNYSDALTFQSWPLYLNNTFQSEEAARH